MEVPDYVDPTVAWRVWLVLARKNGYRLGSVVKPTVWEPGATLEAECLRASRLLARLRRRPRIAPEPDCACGIYGTGLGRMREYLCDLVPRAAVTRVIGRVSLWGTVIECERGVRAAHAYPLELYVPVAERLPVGHTWDEVVTGLEEYGVPVALLPARCIEAPKMLERMELASR